MDVRKYLIYLEDEGWSDLIDERWKSEVRRVLKEKFLDMTDEEWEYISKVVFW